MKTPPLLPIEVLSRTVRLARINGSSVLMVSAAFALLCASGHMVVSAVAGLLVALGAAAEIHGAGRVSQGNASGVNWLVTSQVYLILVIFAYCGYRLTHLDELVALIQPAVTPELRDTIRAQYGISPSEFFQAGFRFGYIAVAFLTLFYQGGMAFLYLRRRRPIEAALHE